MLWHLTHGFDPAGAALADRHYPRQKHGSPQFVPPGRRLVLITAEGDAVWVTSWPDFSRHAWPGAWNCSIFRNESPHLSSLLISQAVAATRAYWPEAIPHLGMITFIDPDQIRRKRDPGRCFRKAGFKPEKQRTKVHNKLCLRLAPEAMPPAEKALAPLPDDRKQLRLLEVAA